MTNKKSDNPANSSLNSSPESNPAEQLELEIEKLVTGGAGLGRIDGQAIFVPQTAPGDQVKIQITKRKKGFIEGQVTEILKPGPGRQEAPCPHYGQCGGCDLQHLNPAAQRAAKVDIVADCFKRLGKIDIDDLITAPDETFLDQGYRNRIRMIANAAGHYGMMRRGTHDIVPIDQCLLMPPLFNEVIFPFLRTLPPVEQVVVRLDASGGWLVSVYGPPSRMKIMKKIIKSPDSSDAPAPGCVGLMYNNLPLWGRSYLLYEIAEHKYRAGAQSFFQGNIEVTEHALTIINSWIKELADAGKLGGLLGDLYCGVGLFSLALADQFEKVIAIDSDQTACRDAKNNVKRGVTPPAKVTVFDGDLAHVLSNPELATADQWASSCCVIDPPRTGLGKDGIASIKNLNPRQVIYMSCDPATMARDTAALIEQGYKLSYLKVLDMFPQTAHIETLLLLERPA